MSQLKYEISGQLNWHVNVQLRKSDIYIDCWEVRRYLTMVRDVKQGSG